MKLRNYLLSILIVSFALIAVACGGADEPVVEQDVATSGPVAEPAQADPGNLVIYSGRSESLVQPIIDQFVAATGINVDVRYGSTPEMTGVLFEEGANSPADVFYAQDPGGLGAAQAAGLLQPLPESILAVAPERFRADDGTWVGVSGRARVVVYNTEAITDPAAQLPDDIFDLIDPQWSGRIGWAPTNASFQAMVTAMRQVWGEEKTSEWLEGMEANGTVAFEGNGAIVEAVGAGEIDAGLVNHYYLYRFLAEHGDSFGARNYFLPGGGPGSLIMVSGVGVLNSAANADNAQRFVEFLLSLPGQQYFAASTFEYPVLQEGVRLAASLPPITDLEASAVQIDLADLADVQGTQDLLIDLGIIE